jgi:molybdopterin-guanine dinucleotide biosynthesis protein A
LIKTLGAILAGGQARRFGSDKAYALYSGKRLIDCAAAALDAQCDRVIICGREEPGFTCIPDLPAADLGPLGGLNAALLHAAQEGYSHVLSAGVDAPNLPHDLAQTLRGEGAAIVQSQPVVGLWPAALAQELSAFLSGGGRALYGFAESVGARRIAFDPPLMNVNKPGDLP